MPKKKASVKKIIPDITENGSTRLMAALAAADIRDAFEGKCDKDIAERSLQLLLHIIANAVPRDEVTPKDKYVLELTEKQASAIMLGLEAFMRLGLAQYGHAIDLALPGKLLPGYNEELENAFNTIKRVIHNLPPNAGHSILHKEEISESVKIAHDIYEVVRHRLSWDKYPEGGSGVSFSQPSKVSKEELPTIKKL